MFLAPEQHRIQNIESLNKYQIKKSAQNPRLRFTLHDQRQPHSVVLGEKKPSLGH
jgi:hypothetical protein